MIYLENGKNIILLNTEEKYSSYTIRIDNVDYVGYVIEESDLYVKLEIIVKLDLIGEYEYTIKHRDLLIESGIAKFEKQKTFIYKEYGK